MRYATAELFDISTGVQAYLRPKTFITFLPLRLVKSPTCPSTMKPHRS